MTDLFTKWVEVVSLADQTTKTFANAFFSEWVCRHGAPTQLFSDRGGQFLSELMKELHTILGVRSIHTTAYHAVAGNGAVERINGILCDMLSKYVREDQKDWEFHLPGILWAYRASPHSTTGESPYYLEHFQDPVFPVDLSFGTSLLTTDHEDNDTEAFKHEQTIRAKQVI